MLFVCLIFGLGAAFIAGSIAIARRSKRLSLVLSIALFALSVWMGIYSSRMLSQHYAGMEGLRPAVEGAGAQLVMGIAFVCALILLYGAFRGDSIRENRGPE